METTPAKTPVKFVNKPLTIFEAIKAENEIKNITSNPLRSSEDDILVKNEKGNNIDFLFPINMLFQ